MPRYFFFLSLLILACSAAAQDRSEGQIIDLSSCAGHTMNYTQTTTETTTDYVTTYSVYNKQNELDYQINAIHPKSGNILSVSFNHYGIRTSMDFSFDIHRCGLIINIDKADDTVFADPSRPYSLLVSFQDTGYTYLYINKLIDSNDQKMIELDKLSGLLILRNKQIISRKLANLAPAFDSAAYYRRIREEEMARRRKEDEEARRIEEERKKLALEKAEIEKTRQNLIRQTYREKYDPETYYASAESAIPPIDSLIRSYLYNQDCKHVRLDLKVYVKIDSAGRVTSIGAVDREDVENMSDGMRTVFRELCILIQSRRYAPATVTISGDILPVRSRLTYSMSVQANISKEKYRFDDNNRLLDENDAVVDGATRAEFLRIHNNNNQFSASKFKVTFCVAVIGAKTYKRILDIEDLEHNPHASRQIYKNIDGK